MNYSLLYSAMSTLDGGALTGGGGGEPAPIGKN